MATLESIYDYYQAAVYDRVLLADSFSRLLDQIEPHGALDCACGTGLPALDLRSRGYQIDCSDADEQMLEHFRRNAQVRGVSDEAWCLKWEELDSLDCYYDVVLCRGNSLAYAESWDKGDSLPASSMSIVNHLRHIARIVVPGGWLIVDAPREGALEEVAYAPVTHEGQTVRVRESVAILGDQRIWTQVVRIGSEEATFTRRSTNVTPAQVKRMLLDLDFEEVNAVSIRGERPSYEVLLARKAA